jgi:microcompartment protein CcmK/EutM
VLLAKIVGTVVATRKDPRLVSNNRCRRDRSAQARRQLSVAIDTVDAGVGETVLVVSGSFGAHGVGLKDVRSTPRSSASSTRSK